MSPISSPISTSAEESESLHFPAGAPTDAVPTFTGDPLRFSQWVKRSATGAVLSGIALGLQQALDHPDNRPAIIHEASSEPDDPDAPLRLIFDPDSPERTVAIIRAPREGDDAGTPPGNGLPRP